MTAVLAILSLAALVGAGQMVVSLIEDKRTAARLIPIPVVSDARLPISRRGR
jgi:hypothetical protein